MSKFCRKDSTALQADLWIQPGELAKGPKGGFYSKLHDVLEGIDFTGQIHQLCENHYKSSPGGASRPPTDPAVIFKMMMGGFLEGIGSRRGIAARIASLALTPSGLGVNFVGLPSMHLRFLKHFSPNMLSR